LHEREVFALHLARGTTKVEDRARTVSQALERIAEDSDASSDTRVEEKDGVAVVFAGNTPLVQLTLDDATAAGDSSLGVHAASVSAKIRDALRTERQRKAIAQTVFAFSLAIFSALVAVLLVRKATELVDRSRAWVLAHPERLPAVRVLSIEIVGKAALRGGLSVGLGAGRVLLQIGIAYTWLILVMSLFEATRGYTERLTGFVLTPLSALLGRIGAALPLLLIAAVGAVAVVVLVRFVALFFGSVARGETRLGWLPPDLAPPTSVLVRFSIMVGALLVAAPLVTGNDDGALSRAGIAALVALGLATTPLLACAAAGIPLVYGRRLRVGQFAEVGGKSGRVRSLSLLEVELEDEHGCALRVPHLSSLLHPTRILGPARLVTTEVVVDPTASQARVRSLILNAAQRIGVSAAIELVRLDAEGAHYKITAAAGPTADGDVAAAVADVLAQEQIPLGRGYHSGYSRGRA
jgi:small-conductance mechanosensitive channel